MRHIRGINEAVRRLIEQALSMGWDVERTRSNHLKFTKPGRRTWFTSGTPSDHRSMLAARSKLRKAEFILA